MDGENVHEKAKAIIGIVQDIKRYAFFKSAQSLGIVFGPSDLNFPDFLLYRAIEEQKGK